MVKIIGPYDSKLKVTTENNAPSMTQQHFKNETDINSIIARYNKTGVFPVATSEGQFGDFSSIADYKTALDAVLDAEDRFLSLPATIRRRFGDDPQRLLEFVSDPNNYDEALALGLVEPRPIPDPIPDPDPEEVEVKKSSKKTTEA